jgi:hypothetical protein
LNAWLGCMTRDAFHTTSATPSTAVSLPAPRLWYLPQQLGWATAMHQRIEPDCPFVVDNPVAKLVPTKTEA